MVRLPRLTPQKQEFFDLFTAAAANGAEIARLLVALLEGWPDSRELLEAIRDAEHEGDRLTYEVVNLLNNTFVTPFDRDDMYRLATVLDDICDDVDEAADDIDAYEVRDVPALARRTTARTSSRSPSPSTRSRTRSRARPSCSASTPSRRRRGSRSSSAGSSFGRPASSPSSSPSSRPGRGRRLRSARSRKSRMRPTTSLAPRAPACSRTTASIPCS
jgi:hypothetical protein